MSSALVRGRLLCRGCRSRPPTDLDLTETVTKTTRSAPTLSRRPPRKGRPLSFQSRPWFKFLSSARIAGSPMPAAEDRCPPPAPPPRPRPPGCNGRHSRGPATFPRARPAPPATPRSMASPPPATSSSKARTTPPTSSLTDLVQDLAPATELAAQLVRRLAATCGSRSAPTGWRPKSWPTSPSTTSPTPPTTTPWSSTPPPPSSSPASTPCAPPQAQLGRAIAPPARAAAAQAGGDRGERT